MSQLNRMERLNRLKRTSELPEMHVKGRFVSSTTEKSVVTPVVICGFFRTQIRFTPRETPQDLASRAPLTTPPAREGWQNLC